MKNNTDDLKNVYSDIKIPDALDDTINNSILRGKNYMKKNNKKRKIINGLVSVAAAIGIFTLSINISPSFANTLQEVPVLGTLVKILQFNNGSSQGGEITDGVDINFISLREGQDFDTINVNFKGFEEETQEIVPSFNIGYKEAPFTMTFSISGARGISANEYFEELKKSKYIEDVYQLMTLDDSQQRFNIVFNQPVDFQIEEYKNPASFKIEISRNTEVDSAKKIYSVRTGSYEKGEEFAILEEMLFDIEGLRILKDSNGTYLYELGQFDSKEEAQEKLKEFESTFKDSIKLYSEERTLNDIPENIR
ncbi:DUF4179 domain-containing protein [Tissierella praeacuta]|uniref:DUF4179 domain-containing protein n=1 Tax=Tissierella praeacuta TaxID=43131 RepID=UPI001C0FBF24|nr:DUF4179 domain-containing protein [Tissierella praeacuta]MBU5256904.1 hypothetical protein [Tissierella praeacuta]